MNRRPKTEAEKRNQRAQMQARWRTSEIIAEHLGIDKSVVYNKLLADIINMNILDGAMRGNDYDLKTIRASEAWNKLTKEEKAGSGYDDDAEFARLVAALSDETDETEEAVEEQEEPSHEFTTNYTDDKSNIAKLKLAFWYIDKVGNIDLAKRLVEIATTSLEALNNR